MSFGFDDVHKTAELLLCKAEAAPLDELRLSKITVLPAVIDWDNSRRGQRARRESTSQRINMADKITGLTADVAQANFGSLRFFWC